MAKHIHIHIHRPTARTRDASKPDPDREALVAALMEAIRAREGKTQDADFKEEEHPRNHGKFTSGGGSGPSGPKPTSAAAKGSKAAVHELLSSGHRFSVDELMKATGCSNKSTLMTALADLKNPKYAGKLGALSIEKHADGGYHVVKDSGKKELPIHPDLMAVTRPGAPIPGSGKAPTKAEEEDMATRAGEPRVDAAPKGHGRATGGQAPDKPTPQSSKLPIHPDLAVVTEPGGTVPGSGKTPTGAEESRMAARAGVPSHRTQMNSETSGGIIRHVIGGGVHSTSPESHRPGDTVYLSGGAGKPTKARVIRGSSVHGYEVRVPKPDGSYDVVKMGHDDVHKTAAEAGIKKKVADPRPPPPDSKAQYGGSRLYHEPGVGDVHKSVFPTWGPEGASTDPEVQSANSRKNQAELRSLLATHSIASKSMEDVPLEGLKSTQAWVVPSKVEKIAKSYDPEAHSETSPVQIWELPSGERVLREGNHRATAARALGHAQIRAQVTRLVADAQEEKPKQATSKAVHDPVEGTHHVVTLPSGAVHKIQRMDSVGSMGLAGWHVVSDKPNGKKGWEAHQPSYMGDTKQDAIRALQDREARRK